MRQQIDLKEIGRKINKAKDNDGFIEIAISSLLITFALLSNWNDPNKLISKDLRFLLSLAPLIVGLYSLHLGRKHITNVRLGIAESRANLARIFSIEFLIRMVVFIVAITIIQKSSGFIKNITASLLILILSWLYAYYSQIKKYYIYGLIMVIPLLYFSLSKGYPRTSIYNLLSFLIPASIFIIIGLVRLKRFMAKYPKPELRDINA